MAILKTDALLETFQTEVKDGLYAEIDEGDRVAHYGWYRNTGSYQERLALDVDYEGSSARVEHFKRHEFTGEATDEKDVRSPEDRYREWVQFWVDKIHAQKGDYIVACDFCGLEQDEVSKLIAGPRMHICNECIELCAAILKEVRLAGGDGGSENGNGHRLAEEG